MSTPPYAPPSIGPAGLVVSSYASILADNLAGFLNIYGQNQNVETDTAIFQFLSIISLKNSDVNLGLQLAVNQSSPFTAIGAGLDRQLKMNGLSRLVFTFSTAPVTVSGTPNAVLTNAFGQDAAGNLWALPSPLTIPVSGSINTTVTCTTPGAVAAEVGAIDIVATPMNGWTPPTGTITNTQPATAGAPVEADSSARARQSISVALPALTPIAATLAAVLATPGVIRVAPGQPTPGGPGTSIENPTGAIDFWGNPAHSISMVVEGGAPAAVALSIYLKKTIGCFTNGTTSVLVTDPTIPSYQETISYFQPTNVAPFVGIYIHGVNSGFTSATLEAVQTAVLLYLGSLAIGASIDFSSVFATVMDVNASLNNPSFTLKSLTLGLTATSLFTVVPGADGGTGYVVGDMLTVVQGGASGGVVTVASVAGGVITGINQQVNAVGTGYSAASNLATTGGTGTGATVNITAVQPSGMSDLTLTFSQAAQGVAFNIVVAGV